jgi:hypothetical protein
MSDEAEVPSIPSFTDTEGREWFLRINCDNTTEILETCGVDLSLPKLDKAYEAMADTKKLVQVLWILVEKQAESQEVAPKDFAGGLDGDAISDAMEALDEAIVNFTPRRTRSVMRKTINTLAKLHKDAMVQAEKTVEKTLEAKGKSLIAMMVKQMEKTIDSPSKSK